MAKAVTPRAPREGEDRRVQGAFEERSAGAQAQVAQLTERLEQELGTKDINPFKDDDTL